LDDNTNPAEVLFKEVIKAKQSQTLPTNKQHELHDTNIDWISDRTYDLFRRKALARRRRQTILAHQLSRQVQRSLQVDRQIRFDKVADEAQAHLAANNSRQAYQFLRNWYKTRKIKPPNPTPTDMDNLQNEYRELYTAVPPTAPPIHTYVHYDIVDTAPNEDEIVEALSRLKPRKTPGASGITSEDLKSWHYKARIAEIKSAESIDLWNKIIEIITIMFTTGHIPSSFYNAILVLVPKPGNKGFRGIALLESLYKVVSMIIHRRSTSSINLHESIHGFRTHRGTGTAIMNVKLLMQYIQRDINPMYMIFLDVKKAYDTVDWDRILQLLQSYGVGPNMLNIIAKI
jgi:Reverse transcriptase (RNA-dependent DNA polymerase)